jgi:hypothetical protein
VRGLPKPLKDILKAEGANVFVAGGYIRSCISREKINDIDVFSPSKEKAIELANRLSPAGKKPHETDNALTIKVGLHIVQFIHRWTFEKPEDCIASFDFTIAKAAIWWSTEDSKWHSACADGFYPDLAGKRLVYCYPIRNEDAGGSLLRVLKFYQAGFRIPLDSLGGVIARLMEGVKEEALPPAEASNVGWHEAAVAKVITGLLREVDPLIDPDAIGHIDSIKDEEISQ